MFYCMFYFTCDRSFTLHGSPQLGHVVSCTKMYVLFKRKFSQSQLIVSSHLLAVPLLTCL